MEMKWRYYMIGVHVLWDIKTCRFKYIWGNLAFCWIFMNNGNVIYISERITQIAFYFYLNENTSFQCIEMSQQVWLFLSNGKHDNKS